MIKTSKQLKDLIRILSRKSSADKRGTLQMEDAVSVFDEIEQSPIMEGLW